MAFNMKPTSIHVSNKDHHKWDGNSSEPASTGTTVDTTKSTGFSFLSISPKNVVLSTLKLPQESSHNDDPKVVILRLYETEGKTVTADIKFHYPIKSALYANLIEDVKGNTYDDNNDYDEEIMISGPSKNILRFTIQGFKIITLRIEFDF